MIILGIDPGSHVTGFGVIEMNGSAETILDFGVIRTKGAGSHQLRLKQIYECICELIEQHHPDVCAVEMPVHGNNVQSMLKLGRAQASVMLAALNRQIPVSEYSPKQVKKAVTGNGNASKEQVRYMVQSIDRRREPAARRYRCNSRRPLPRPPRQRLRQQPAPRLGVVRP